MIKEAVVETFDEIIYAANHGANRIELCDNLFVGGTTPSFGLVKLAIEYCHPLNIEVAVMIRPRGGDYTYNLFEKEVMREDIIALQSFNIDAFVFGALTNDDALDTLTMHDLRRAALNVPCVMHMAFDQIPLRQQLKAMDALIHMNFKRILTHGSEDKSSPILDNVNQLGRLLRHSKGNIEIMPGGGLHKDNLNDLLELIPFQEVHGTKIV